MRIGSHIHVEVVAEEIAVPMGVPSPVTVWLGIAAFTVTGITATFPAVTDPLFALLCGQEFRLRQEPDGQGRSTLCEWKDPETAAYKGGK